MSRPRAQVGDRVQMRRAPLFPGEPDGFDERAPLGTVERVIEASNGSATNSSARVRWDNGSSAKHSLGMLRVLTDAESG